MRRILALALVQLVPIIGQLLLLGYGLDVVRAVYAGYIGLPPIRWLSALSDGLRLLLAGLVYLLPVLVTGAVIGASSVGAGDSTSRSSLGTIGTFLAIGLPLLLFFIRMISSIRRKRSPTSRRTRAGGGGLRSLLSGLLPILVTILAILLLRALVVSSGIESGRPNALSALLFLVLALLLFLIGIALGVGGVRYSIEDRGLLAATTNASLLLKNRTLSGPLLLNVLLLDVLAILATSIGLIVFLLPGLFVFVVCSLAVWYIFARYGMAIGIRRSSFTFSRSPASVS